MNWEKIVGYTIAAPFIIVICLMGFIKGFTEDAEDWWEERTI